MVLLMTHAMFVVNGVRVRGFDFVNRFVSVCVCLLSLFLLLFPVNARAGC